LKVVEAEMVNLRWPRGCRRAVRRDNADDLLAAVLPETENRDVNGNANRIWVWSLAGFRTVSGVPATNPQAEEPRHSAAPQWIAMPPGESPRGKGLRLFEHVACDLLAPAIDRH
jgi:hypothetical protein